MLYVEDLLGDDVMLNHEEQEEETAAIE